jgi:hypothetical protein
VGVEWGKQCGYLRESRLQCSTGLPDQQPANSGTRSDTIGTSSIKIANGNLDLSSRAEEQAASFWETLTPRSRQLASVDREAALPPWPVKVRTLAQRSATADKAIKELIGESAHGSIVARSLLRKRATINEIIQSVKRVTDIMSEIAAPSEEQSARVDQLNMVVTQMAEVIQQYATVVEEAPAAARSTAQQTQALRDVVARFKVGLVQVGLGLMNSGSSCMFAPSWQSHESARHSPMPMRRYALDMPRSTTISTASFVQSRP